MLKIRYPIPRFLSAGEIFSGRGSVAALRALAANRALLLVSPSLAQNQAIIDRIVRSVGAVETKLLVAPHGEPSLSALGPLQCVLSEFRPDWIVAVGGGSVLDTGKLLWILHEHQDIDLNQMTRPFALPPLRGKTKFAALPTTAGSGSEVSSATVFIDQDSGRKKAIVGHDLLPDLAILDPELMTGLPPEVLAASALDALSHAIEGYVSRVENPLVDVLVEKAASIIFEKLPTAFGDSSALDARGELMHAALFGGWVQNLKVPGIGHAVAHQLGKYGVSHGRACAAFLSEAVDFNLKETRVREKYNRLARSLGLNDADALVTKIAELKKLVGLATPIEAILGEQILSDLPEIIVGAREDICFRMNPRETSDRELSEFIRRAL